ncbi:MAG TPA: DNA polymerase III subunit gamma/tau [Chloroflexota bacterium]|nr:DNA polymerase III subunit gamma/tau [Chloroflexota bacterium]
MSLDGAAGATAGSSALYNRWRSRTFANPDDLPLIGQDHITRTLRNAVAAGQIAHAYLFCGPRGTGKTSAARILARAVNCRRGLQGEPCNQCENCQALLSGRQLDLLIEIDGASNRGVDDVRALRERLLQRPGGADLTGRFKVYIIDEVHMLTTEAFNALLKSLEEPPSHVIFILCTTDPQKVPATVASRCQRFDFKPIPLETLARHLSTVAASEGVELEPPALELLARTAAGGARDAVSLLDQALSFAGATGHADGKPGKKGKARLKITAAQIQAMLGLTDFEAVSGLVDAVAARDLAAGLRLVQEVASHGSDLRQFARQVIEFLRAALLHAGNAGELASLDDETRDQVRLRAERLGLPEIVRLLKLFATAENGLKSPAAQPQLPLELALVEATLAPTESVAPVAPTPSPARPTRPAPPVAPAKASTRAPATPSAGVQGAVPPVEAQPRNDASEESLGGLGERSVPQDPRPEPPKAIREAPVPPPTPDSALDLPQVKTLWPSVLDAVRQTRNLSLEALLRDGEPTGVESGNTVVVAFKFPFHASKVQEPANVVTVNRALSKALGVRATVRCEVAGGAGARAERQRPQSAPDDPVVSKVLRMLNARVMTPAELAAIEAMPIAAEFEAGDL